MKASNSDKIIIGRVEKVNFPELSKGTFYARIDTGAQTSSIWANSVSLKSNRLAVVFFGPEHPLYSGEKLYFDEFTSGMVASSNGQAELRYKVKLSIRLGSKKIRASFTLADRSTQTYPVLIGRNVLRGKFVVDVKLGDALKHAERERSKTLQSQIENEDKK